MSKTNDAKIRSGGGEGGGELFDARERWEGGAERESRNEARSSGSEEERLSVCSSRQMEVPMIYFVKSR